MVRTASGLLQSSMLTLLLTTALLVSAAGPGPSFSEAAPVGAYERDNPLAEDLLDHWNEPKALEKALGLMWLDEADEGDRRDAAADLFSRVGNDPAETRIKLRNVRPEDMEIIGKRGEVTYGRWKGGPAGTLNIEFDWRFAQDFDAEARARMERAGKSWSWRILDDFGQHVLNAGKRLRYRSTVTRKRETIRTDEDLTADDLLIVVVKDGERGSAGSVRYGFGRETSYNDYEPWFGLISLPQDRHNQTSTMAHEIGHILGMGNRSQPSVKRYNNTRDNVFEGPKAMEANGGRPVPFQWQYRGRKPGPNQPVAPNSPGAKVDRGHLNVCTSVMAYCRDRTVTYGPSAIDLGYLADIGYEILDADTASRPEVYGNGAWGLYSAWGAGVERTIRYESGDPGIHLSQGGIIVDAHDKLRARVDAFGVEPDQGLADSQEAAVWSGSLVGVDLTQPMLPPVFGDAELRVDSSNRRVTVSFANLTVHVDGVSKPFRIPRLNYVMAVTGNAVSDENGRVRGGFYGPAHEEMAGVLEHRTPGVGLLAAFGGRR